LGKRDPSAADPNDPYRFGLPDQPPPPEYAPPGWVPPGGWPAPSTPQPGVQQGYGPPPGYPPTGYPPPPPPYPGPPPSYPPYQARQRGRGKAITALVLGVLSIVLSVTAFIDALLVIPAVVFGVVAITERPAGPGSGRGMAIAGLVCAGIGALLAIIWTVWAFRAINECGGVHTMQVGGPGFRACLRQHFG
jgi:hypothetical protein